MQAIRTKYLPATNYKPSRMKASAEAGSVTISWDDEFGQEENHIRAARALAEKFEWTGPRYSNLVTGYSDDGYVHVFLPEAYALAKEAVILTRLAMRDGRNNGNPHLQDYGRAVDALTDENGAFAADYAARVAD